MALQVWLPLTKDTRNQGLLGDINFSATGTISDGNGKVGKCKVFSSSNLIAPFSYTLGDEGTLSVWVNLTANPPSDGGYFFEIASQKLYANAVVGLGAYGGNDKKIAVMAGGKTDYTFAPGFVLNQWHHIVFVWSNTEDSYLYFDGALVKTYTNLKGGTIKSGNKFSIASSVEGTGLLSCKLNDIRIYDHCLSPMEVKELSKGLVLHYPLNRNGWGQENLMPNSIEMPVGSANPSTGTWRLAGSSQMTRSRVAISDAPSGASTCGFQSVGLQTGQDASCWGIDGFPRENGATYTLSAWGRIVGGSSTAAMLGFSVHSGTTLDYGGTYGKAVSSDAKYYGSGAYDYAGGQLNPNGNWTRIYCTFTSTSASDNIYIGFNTAKTGSNVTLQLCGVKLEKGDKMTPWVPNSNESMYTTLDLNGTTEYDCSGFCNNGIKNNLPTYSSDTAKYNVSTYLNGVNQTIQLPNLSTLISDGIFTFSIWFKKETDKWSSKSWETIFGGPSGFEFQSKSGSTNSPLLYAYSWGKGTKIYTLDEWHHFVMVRTTEGTTFYLDGEQAFTGTAGSIPSGNYFLGSWSSTTRQNYKGFMGDARIYATALSADDVKSLYKSNKL